ncbi:MULTISPECIES: hypothetical protein [Paenibacillus]|uniref:hypothetical protein n=1 Tax=Paenibacillus TaxID=44249 RepID=UPI0022B89A62|nr:hypothetical protein [Paenibacillus caseinilyticus]MCZ8521250.1 hypothetical protein [Paenibacillus caseinilyticus]
MEKRLVKGAVYSFLLGACLAILFIPDSKTITAANGSISTTTMIPVAEYLIQVVRFAVKVMFGTLIALWLLDLWRLDRGEMYAFAAGMVKSFIVVSLFIVLVVLIANWVR